MSEVGWWVQMVTAVARERTGKQRPDETDDDYAERVAENLPRASRIPVVSPEQGTIANERQRRATRSY